MQQERHQAKPEDVGHGRYEQELTRLARDILVLVQERRDGRAETDRRDPHQREYQPQLEEDQQRVGIDHVGVHQGVQAHGAR